MRITLLLYILKLIYLIFITGLRSLMVLFIRTYRPTVSYRDALDRLCVHLSIILFVCVVLKQTSFMYTLVCWFDVVDNHRAEGSAADVEGH